MGLGVLRMKNCGELRLNIGEREKRVLVSREAEGGINTQARKRQKGKEHISSARLVNK